MVTMSEDTTATHCGSCHHLGVGRVTRKECRADSRKGEPVEWDEAAQSSVRSAACHEAELRAPVLALVMGSKSFFGPEPTDVSVTVPAPLFEDEEAPPSTDPAPVVLEDDELPELVVPYDPASVAADRRSDTDETPPLRTSER